MDTVKVTVAGTNTVIDLIVMGMDVVTVTKVIGTAVEIAAVIWITKGLYA